MQQPFSVDIPALIGTSFKAPAFSRLPAPIRQLHK